MDSRVREPNLLWIENTKRFWRKEEKKECFCMYVYDNEGRAGWVWKLFSSRAGGVVMMLLLQAGFSRAG